MYKTTVKIDGMMCSMCETHIAEAIRKAEPEVSRVKASHKKGVASFFSEDEVDMTNIRKAIEDTGYDFIEAESRPYEKKGFFGLGKGD